MTNISRKQLMNYMEKEWPSSSFRPGQRITIRLYIFRTVLVLDLSVQKSGRTVNPAPQDIIS